jgi:NitT/TauT family transport system permease protein
VTSRQTVLWQVALGLASLGLWEAMGRLGAGNFVSRPSLVAAKLIAWFGGTIYVHLGTTIIELVLGMAIGSSLGIVAGLALGRSPVSAAVLRPMIVALYSVPLVALAPLFVMFLGLGVLPKVVLVGLVTFFLLFFNTFAGAERIDLDQVHALELMGASRGEIFRKVVAPGTTMWIIGGLKIALPYALVATITGELLATRAGLGFLLSQASERFDMAALYAVLFILMSIGLLLSEASSRLEGRLLHWRQGNE